MRILIKKGNIFLAILFIILGLNLSAQVVSPVKWSFEQKKISDKEIELRFNALINPGWHLYGTDLPDGGPVSTSFKFIPDSTNYRLAGKLISQSKPVSKFDKIFNLELSYYAVGASFTIKVTLLGNRPFTIKGTVEYQSCNDETCIMNEDDFSFQVIPIPTSTPTSTSEPVITSTPNSTATPALTSTSTITSTPVTAEVSLSEGNDITHHSLIWFLFFSFLAGLAAILTPCVFPMIPMTVSFFMNSNKTKWEAKFQAMVYGASIILIYTLIGTVVAITLGADFANWLSTHWLPNVLFFIIFVVFAFSFFGAFEIILPSRWVNKSDDKVSQGGVGGAFFMALTLVLVSFSCTGPIVGAILVESAGGMILKPIVGMFGFSLAFALPFTLFALFPQWLSNLPKSGGWLNSVKIVLGFIELALGLKFLSIADQTYHWRILDREVYIAFWIVISILLGIYLLGKLRFAHDSEVKHVSTGRLMLAIVTFTFVVYLIPGMFGAPLKAISGYLPPMTTHDFDLHKIIRDEVKLVGSSGGTADIQNLPGKSLCEKPKYSEFLELPHGLEGYFDFEQGIACAKAQNKPVFIDFTGHGCVNCREMEANVWSDPRVLERLKRDFIIIALYVDDKTTMPESDWITSTYDKKIKKTIGKKYADFQIARFGVNAQPYYVILDHNQKMLVKPTARDLNPDHFIDFLDRGLAAFKNEKK
jgi:thiol:disulfide interchange protein DsbD